MNAQLNYGNWIRKKKLLILGLCTLGTGALVFIPLDSLYRLVIIILFAILLISFFFPLYAYVMFSQQGGRFQEKVYDLIIQNLGTQGKGRLLDIGSGNGVLAVKLAGANPEAEVVGVDYWGKDWEYSKTVCDQNARIAQVDGRVHFQKGDAAALDFPNEAFDGAVSNLTFHEVRSVADKREVLREALRVVKPGGGFAFIDYFFDAKCYENSPELREYLKDLKLSQFECKPLPHLISVPMLLRHPKILGKVGMIWGRK
jgi:SAM-dependent methyltransferase